VKQINFNTAWVFASSSFVIATALHFAILSEDPVPLLIGTLILVVAFIAYVRRESALSVPEDDDAE
jgi:inner membrane protein involved in colicin E2 resistance